MTPHTAAGRALADDVNDDGSGDPFDAVDITPRILAIEQEAAAAAIERVRVALNDARTAEGAGWRWSVSAGTLAAIDAILDAAASPAAGGGA